MKHIWLPLIFFLLLSLTNCNNNQISSDLDSDTTVYESTVIFLTRHAEKDTVGRDPELSEKGRKRVEVLTNMLKNVKFDAVYSTNYLRTIQTVRPIAELNSLVIMPYEAQMPPEKFSEQLLNDEKGNTILISGHSNTIPFIVNSLMGFSELGQLDENQYGDLFMIIISGNNKELITLNQPIID
ncbi:phosphoglycerate mutase family protein [Marinigracilibium pacificum]|uniref:Histidine phosphatase family protein n=1 Tax=Marinigracilibium pacificum TaxID=2729599 RepID=A0A848J1I0_9BACT|nr:phosphoglycerate mutase family protein [Marinigracilibium pacificum]NMM50407.1 histidine phosphatase family protein [Marinigracilibium pacificum]